MTFMKMSELITGGFVYIAQPPLYKISKGKKSHWVYTDKEKDMLLEKLQEDGKKTEIQRYKGLGEMNKDQLWETTMNKENRTLLQVTISDAAEANLIFSTLMGEDVESRRDFIVTNSKLVTNLDV